MTTWSETLFEKATGTSVMPKSTRDRNHTSGEASGVRLGQRLPLQTTDPIGSLVGTEAAAAAAGAAPSTVVGATTHSTRIEKIENKSLYMPLFSTKTSY
jgi:hypothetical protein